jgi:alkylation response protein AidB-like acyl-CoA dehydrogenase
LLPRIVNGTDKYCQGFSEPEAGSDLKALSTRAVVEGDELRITGQKVWTTAALEANMTFCLCRTADAGEPHRSISYVIVPMFRSDGSANGVNVRPIRQPTGLMEFAELFLDDARAPLDNVIGGLNNGWRVAMTTLGAERGGASELYIPFARQFCRAVEEARANGVDNDPVRRQFLAAAYTDVQIMRFMGLRVLGAAEADQPVDRVGLLTKLHWSEYEARFSSKMLNLRGARSLLHDPDLSDGHEDWMRTFLFAPAYRIAGGTSEVLRDVVAERALGLPRQ